MNLQAIARQQLTQPLSIDFTAKIVYITYVIKKVTKGNK
jgi:hypothetical protein